MSPADLPESVRLEPGSGELPPALGRALTDPDQPILLLVAADAGDASLRTAVVLAEGRAARGSATILGDGGLADPRLHRLLDVENLEGLADLFLFGASLPRIVTRPDTWHFDFAPAGAYVPDPAEVLDSPRWERIGADLSEAGTLLVLFVPAGTPGLAALSGRARRAILISSERDAGRVGEHLDEACEVLAVVEPLAAITPEALVTEAGGEIEPGAATIFDDARLTEPPVFRSDRKSRRAAPSILLLVALAAALGVGGWFLYQEYLAGPRVEAALAPERPQAPPPARGAAVETPIPISVAVEAHQDLGSAWQRVRALRRAETGTDFYLAPVSVNGVLYYRLLAGPVTDREAGTALLQRLVDANHKTAYDTWAVRPTQFAFHLGEYDTREEADARVDALAAVDVPAYVVTIRYDPGSPGYRVYGGAYETAAEAEVMGEMLENADQEARLVPRTGQPAA